LVARHASRLPIIEEVEVAPVGGNAPRLTGLLENGVIIFGMLNDDGGWLLSPELDVGRDDGDDEAKAKP
jgi:hypothetical protein